MFLRNKIFTGYTLKFLILGLVFGLYSCSEDTEEIKEQKANLSFKVKFESSLNRAAVQDLPACSEAVPAYAKVVLTGPENYGSVASPGRIDFSTATETENINLAPGTYELEYFAVYDNSDNMIWFAPNATEFTEFVPNPLPASVATTAYNSSNLTVEVVCYNDRTLIDPDAITAEEYVASLGAGLDVTWSEFTRYMELYQEQVASDFGDAGFRNVRIRVQEDNPDAEFMANLKQQIQDAINNDMNPILAFQARYLEDVAPTDEDARTYLVEWWRDMAVELQDMPAELSFNIIVELSGNYKTDYEAINSFYVDVYDAIRESNPNRIIIFPPVNLSNPEFLQFLEIPGGDDPYVMAEWHFYAAGPDPTPGSRKYWNDGSTLEERRNLLDPIETAVAWMNETGYVSWVGAWMPGNYNKGNDYTVEEQVDIASFITRTLNSYDIPFAVNAGNKFYDYENLEWFNRTDDAGGIPIRDVIMDPDKIALYSGVDYSGTAARLEVGDYTASDLQTLGFYENTGSLMLPFDYEVTVYDGDDFTGTSQVLDITTRDLSSFNVRSLKVAFKNSY